MKNSAPPKVIVRLLERFCDPHLLEGILGDLQERFHQQVQRRGVRLARLIYVWQALGFFRWSFRNQNRSSGMTSGMLVNYWVSAWRSMLRRKSFSAINLVGLVCAVACSLFAFVLLWHDLHYDRIHEKRDHIYQLYKRHLNEREQIDHLTAETSGMMGPTMKREYPEIKGVVRICPWWDKVRLYRDDEMHETTGWCFVDSSFLDVFDYPLLHGDADKVLRSPRSMVITEQLATRIFPSTDPMGQTITGINDIEFVVEGVIADPGPQSTLQFEALVSWSTTVPGVGPLSFGWMNNWLAQSLLTFVELDPQAVPASVEAKLPDMMERFFPERADQYFLRLQPFQTLHLRGSEIRAQRGMDLTSRRFLTSLILSTLLIVCIVVVNYINITLSRAFEKRKEIGVRKALGSGRFQLMVRFMIETVINLTVASMIAYAILPKVFLAVGETIGRDLSPRLLLQPSTFVALLSLYLVFCLLMGLYPAFILARPRASRILQGSMSGWQDAGLIRKVLLGVQYGMATILIICTIVIIKQTTYLQQKPLGFDKENVVVVDLYNEVGAKAEVFESDLLQHPSVLSVSIGRSAIGGGSYSTTFIPEGQHEEVNTRVFSVDADFFETYGLTVNQGRSFLTHSIADSMHVIVNQSLIDFVKWEDPVGKRLKPDRAHAGYPIIGVVDDFHYASLATEAVEPMAIFLSVNDVQNASIKLDGESLDNSLSHIEAAWNKSATKTPFEFYFVDQWFASLYQDEEKLLRTTRYFALIGLLLCVLGLYGLTALTLQQRRREISIRKVLGASAQSIIRMISKDFVLIIVLSFALAIPVSYAVTSAWLADFAHRIHLGGGAFLLACFMILLVSLVVISLLSARAAAINPATTLRSD